MSTTLTLIAENYAIFIMRNLIERSFAKDNKQQQQQSTLLCGCGCCQQAELGLEGVGEVVEDTMRMQTPFVAELHLHKVFYFFFLAGTTVMTKLSAISI